MPRVDLRTLGAWVLTCNPAVTDLAALLSAGGPVTSWCVADNYRSALMAAAQPALLWVSGPGRPWARGFWGLGTVQGPAAATPGSRTLTARLALHLLPEPLPAAELAVLPGLEGVEVLRQPFMSNPSWLDRDQYRVVRSRLGVDPPPGAPPIG
ncbi:hypothetical protein [Nakamurella endophytica]|uniref:EVE domain-containing protein n=1 Tax=Nakamurella endophytica TaxID=1748367 RepID=A0A917WBW7_9ACTN|nr:hypothetical protein [Nakamurella endophytica]GGL88300.1 hypothetical protein GCM10011594_04920 [Nakamurella endophytica]